MYVLAPPFVKRPQAEREALRPHGQRRRSFLRTRREQPPSTAATTSKATAIFTDRGAEGKGGTEDVTVPTDIDLTALPQLCFPGGLQVTSEQRDEQFHFLVFTDIFGNRTHGAVMQCYRPILVHSTNGTGSSKFSKIFSAYSFCVISKYPYFNVLKDCLSCLLTHLRTSCLSDMERRVREFAAKLSLVPIPPHGLHLMFTLCPLTIVLPSREDKDHPAVDLDLHLPFLCFRPQKLLQVISCLLQEQRVVLFSADWARLTLVAESLLLFLQPMSWQQPYVPVLARGMLDFLMAPTAFLMGCHVSHFEEVATETDDLILINIDNGSVSTSHSNTVDIPDIPPAAADLTVVHKSTSRDINCIYLLTRRQRREWQYNLNHDIQRTALELIVNVFRDVSSHLNYEHRVFNSEEFLKSREPTEQPFYKKVLETHIFHSFLKDRLNRKMDNYARMEQSIHSEMNSNLETRLIKRPNLPNLRDNQIDSFQRSTVSPPKPVMVFKLPDFPVSLSFHCVQSYYSELIQQLGKAIFSVQNENPFYLARYYYLRGFINTLCSRRLDALSDFQNLNKTDTVIFPNQLVTWIVDSLHQDERQQADKRPELKRLILRVKNEKPLVPPDDHVKKFKLPKEHMHQDEFVRCVQECGIVKDLATINRLFDALSDGPSKQVHPFLFKNFYTLWKETETEAQDVNLPPEVIDHLDNNESVFKVSSCVRTSHGVGKIAMTQKRLFLLTEGRPVYLEIAKFRDIQTASASFLLLRIPSLHIHTSSRPEVFEANLKTETELWNLVVREMWAGRKMADQHKDPQYMSQALTNVLLMHAVTGCLQTQRPITAASKLAYFDKIKHEVPMSVSETTSETLKHKINPSLDLAEPQTVHVLLYTPGQLKCSDSTGGMNPKLWVALSGGKVVIFDAATWCKLQDSIQVGVSQLNCMLGLVQDQVWIGSQDSVIYIIDTHSMSCNKQLTEHRHEVTGLMVDTRDQHNSQESYSCSCDGTILQWDLCRLKVKQQIFLKCNRLLSIQIHDDAVWCCKYTLSPVCSNLKLFSSLFSPCEYLSQGQVWAGCADSGELCLWYTNNHLLHPSKRIILPSSSGVTCMIRVKGQVSWATCQLRSQVLVVDPQSHTVTKELQAHSDSIQTLCSAEDRYVLSGSARRDGRIAIWKVE
uniref:DENN domain-containing protein 3-like n=1 Tax=Mastacembelus armatus TaxID=205130 RepID=A0A7N8XHV0_9TELE